jgi:hypothetical protein
MMIINILSCNIIIIIFSNKLHSYYIGSFQHIINQI